MEMNEQAGKRRQRSARARDPGDKSERFFRAQLESLVRKLAKEIEAEVLPIVEQEEAEYQVGDAVPTFDAWADRIIAALRKVAKQFVGESLEEQYERLAKRTVSMAEAESTSAFVKSVNEAVGVDVSKMLNEEDMAEYVQAAAHQNAQLIKSVPEQHLQRVEEAVLGGVRGGDRPEKIARQIREATGITARRAQEIARDQTAKIHGEVTERRQKQAGVKYFRWVTSKDERVGDDHRRAARRDVGFGPGVYRWDDPPPEGVPGNANRPNCRCTATPVFEWELPNRKRSA